MFWLTQFDKSVDPLLKKKPQLAPTGGIPTQGMSTAPTTGLPIKVWAMPWVTSNIWSSQFTPWIQNTQASNFKPATPISTPTIQQPPQTQIQAPTVDHKQAILDLWATIQKGNYKTPEELQAKFPEFKGVDKQVFMDLWATIQSWKYKTPEEIMSKFPELTQWQSQPLQPNQLPTPLQSTVGAIWSQQKKPIDLSQLWQAKVVWMPQTLDEKYSISKQTEVDSKLKSWDLSFVPENIRNDLQSDLKAWMPIEKAKELYPELYDLNRQEKWGKFLDKVIWDVSWKIPERIDKTKQKLQERDMDKKLWLQDWLTTTLKKAVDVFWWVVWWLADVSRSVFSRWIETVAEPTTQEQKILDQYKKMSQESMPSFDELVQMKANPEAYKDKQAMYEQKRKETADFLKQNLGNLWPEQVAKAVLMDAWNWLMKDENVKKWLEELGKWMENYKKREEKNPESAYYINMALDTVEVVWTVAWVKWLGEWAVSGVKWVSQLWKNIIEETPWLVKKWLIELPKVWSELKAGFKEWLQTVNDILPKVSTKWVWSTEEAIAILNKKPTVNTEAFLKQKGNNDVWEAIQPKMSQAEIETRKSTMKGLSKKVKYLPQEAEHSQIELAKNLWVNAGKTANENKQVVQSALETESNKLPELIKKSWVKFDDKTTLELWEELSKIKPPFTIKSTELWDKYQGIIDKFQEILIDNKWDVLKSRKDFDYFAKKELWDIYSSERFAPLKQAVMDVRETANKFLDKKVGDKIVSESLKKQSDMYRIIDKLNTNLEKQWSSSLSRWMKSNPKKTDLIKKVWIWVWAWLGLWKLWWL